MYRLTIQWSRQTQRRLDSGYVCLENDQLFPSQMHCTMPSNEYGLLLHPLYFS